MQVTPNQDFFNRKKVSISSISDNYFYSVHCKVLESLEDNRTPVSLEDNRTPVLHQKGKKMETKPRC